MQIRSLRRRQEAAPIKPYADSTCLLYPAWRHRSHSQGQHPARRTCYAHRVSRRSQAGLCAALPGHLAGNGVVPDPVRILMACLKRRSLGQRDGIFSVCSPGHHFLGMYWRRCTNHTIPGVSPGVFLHFAATAFPGSDRTDRSAATQPGLRSSGNGRGRRPNDREKPTPPVTLPENHCFLGKIVYGTNPILPVRLTWRRDHRSPLGRYRVHKVRSQRQVNSPAW